MTSRTKAITFSTPTSDQCEKIYESYRLDRLPDSPSKPFSTLSEKEKKEWVEIRKKVTHLIVVI